MEFLIQSFDLLEFVSSKFSACAIDDLSGIDRLKLAFPRSVERIDVLRCDRPGDQIPAAISKVASKEI
jgi:hypothetical protein